MEVIHGLDKLKKKQWKTAVTVGVFDGIHKGHQRIIREAAKSAREMKVEAVVVTFEPYPLKVLSGSPRPLLLCPSGKFELLEEFGIDMCLIIDFSRRFSELSPHDFTKKILVEHLGAKLLVIGFNYVFGKDRKGNAEFLSGMGRKYGFLVRACDPVKVNGETVSSTRIRQLVKEGNVEKAGSFLGRPYEITGTVAEGKSRGNVIGYPTANLSGIKELVPAPGVYGGYAVTGGRCYKSALNIGWRPTFKNEDGGQSEKNNENPIVEAHIIGFTGSIYGQEVRFGFIKKIRDEIAFGNESELKKQIKIDVEKINSCITIDDNGEQ